MDSERWAWNGARLVCSGVRFRKIRAVVKRNDCPQHLFSCLCPSFSKWYYRRLLDEMKHVFRLQASYGHSCAIRSTLFAGVSEGVDDIYFLVHVQINGSKYSNVTINIA